MTQLKDKAPNLEGLREALSKWVKKEDIYNIVYPVGSVYYTTVDGFDPNVEFGGTWEKFPDGIFLRSANGTTAMGAVGGEENHTLTIAEMPNHTHSGTTSSVGDHSHARPGWIKVASGDDKQAANKDKISSDSNFGTDPAGGHYHTLNINSVGNGQAHNNLPPYEAVAIWRRTA